MQVRFEHFATTSMLGDRDSPPRRNGRIAFEQAWERDALGIALALAKKGCYEWEEFRQGLIASIADWESRHAPDDASWSYYEQWLEALERIALWAGVVDEMELDRRTQELCASGGTGCVPFNEKRGL